MSCNSMFARIFWNQDVAVSSPQPQPIDDIAGMRAVLWDNSAPCIVQAYVLNTSGSTLRNTFLPPVLSRGGGIPSKLPFSGFFSSFFLYSFYILGILRIVAEMRANGQRFQNKRIFLVKTRGRHE